ncbi:MAG: NEAT domain-containing protein [Bacillaceae bacterium]|nr:NEAT domain-containing protein [Bacillaceae bacterium]
MKKLFALPFSILVVVCLVSMFLSPAVFANSSLKDGTYTINYSVLKADNDSASMADGHFAKPATLTVKNGQMNAHVKITTDTIKSLEVATGGSNKSDAGISDIKFKVPNLSSPVKASMHVVVPESNYDATYTIRFAFDAASAKCVSDCKSENNQAASNTANTNSNSNSSDTNSSPNTTNTQTNTTVANPETNDTTSFLVLGMLLVVSSLFLGRKLISLNK